MFWVDPPRNPDVFGLPGGMIQRVHVEELGLPEGARGGLPGAAFFLWLESTVRFLAYSLQRLSPELLLDFPWSCPIWVITLEYAKGFFLGQVSRPS